MEIKKFEQFVNESNSFDDKIFDFCNKNWDDAWNICKTHGITKGMSKSSIKESRPGYLAMWISDLNKSKKLSEEEIKIINK